MTCSRSYTSSFNRCPGYPCSSNQQCDSNICSNGTCAVGGGDDGGSSLGAFIYMIVSICCCVLCVVTIVSILRRRRLRQ